MRLVPRLTTRGDLARGRPGSASSTASTCSRFGNAVRDEEVLDAAVLGAAQQDDLGVVDAAAGAADLLVVGDHRAGRLVVDDPAEVGLVVAHAERARGDDRLDVVAQQPLLDGDRARSVSDLAGVRLGGDALRVQPLRDGVGVALGERVDDARARQLAAGASPARRGGRPGRGSSTTSSRSERARQRPAVGAHARRAAPRRRRPRGRWRSRSCPSTATPSGSRSSTSAMRR